MTENVQGADLRSLVAPVYDEFHWRLRLRTNVHYWLKGGRGGARSSCASLEIVQGLIRDPDAHAVVIRKVKDTLRGSVFEQIKWAITKLKVEHLFHIPEQKLEITLKATGQKIFFRGADDPSKIKSVAVAKGIIKYLWYEEANQLGGLQDIRKINQSILRGESKYFVAIYTFNPPRNPNHWINMEVAAKRDDYFVVHATYLDVPREWNGEVFHNEAEQLKRRNFAEYEHEYLGLANGKGYDTVIEYAVLKYALASFQEENKISLLSDSTAPFQVGIDVARKGDDKSVVYVKGNNILDLGFEMQKNKTTELTGKTVHLVNEIHQRANGNEIELYVDETGVGGGVVDELIESLYDYTYVKIIGVNNGSSPSTPKNKTRYANLGAQMWFQFKELLEVNEQCIKKDNVAIIRIKDYDITVAQLTDRKYEVTSKGLLKLESKEDMKKRGGVSPDHADAIILASADLNSDGYSEYIDFDNVNESMLIPPNELSITNW